MLNRIPIRSILCLCFAFAQAIPAFSETYEHGLTISPSFGRIYFDNDRQLDDTNIVSIGLGYQFTPNFELEMTYAENKTDIHDANNHHIDYSHYRLDGLFNLVTGPKFTPYLALGAGQHNFESSTTDDNLNFLNFGFGAKAWLSNNVAVRADLREFINTEDQFGEKPRDTALTVGLTYAFGRGPVAKEVPPVAPAPPIRKDSDGDGVYDDEDLCPMTLIGATVDKTGCIPDLDGDGVINSKDQCPNTSVGAKVDHMGCYIVLTDIEEINLKINFPNDSFTVPSEYMDDIEAVADFMDTYPLTEVILEGHTDSIGSAAYNKELSRNRAIAVGQILIDTFGIHRDRVSFVGYGEADPVAENSTAEGRAENRRVVAMIQTSISRKLTK